MKFLNRFKVVIVILGIMIIGIIWTRTMGFVGLNLDHCLSGKVFYGTYKKAVHDGNYVIFYYKGDKIIKKNERMIKKVGCTSGERIVTHGLKYFCVINKREKYIGSACTKAIPRCPTHIVFNKVIPKGKLFVYGTSIDSYDSRYWGLLNTKKIVGKAYKVF